MGSSITFLFRSRLTQPSGNASSLSILGFSPGFPLRAFAVFPFHLGANFPDPVPNLRPAHLFMGPYPGRESVVNALIKGRNAIT